MGKHEDVALFKYFGDGFCVIFSQMPIIWVSVTNHTIFSRVSTNIWHLHCIVNVGL
jgi:hypothetical protein